MLMAGLIAAAAALAGCQSAPPSSKVDTEFGATEIGLADTGTAESGTTTKTDGAVSQASARGDPASANAFFASSGNADDYMIGPHDLLEITVFRIDELSRQVRVSSRGTFSLPLIGTVEAAGLTAAELEARIAAKLLECCLQDPQVSVFIKEFVSQRVTLEGDLRKPGVYPLTGRTTLLQALALASGSGDLADLSEVRVFREERDGTRKIFAHDVGRIRAGEIVDPVIKGNDIVVVSRSKSRAVFKWVTDRLPGFSSVPVTGY